MFTLPVTVCEILTVKMCMTLTLTYRKAIGDFLYVSQSVTVATDVDDVDQN